MGMEAGSAMVGGIVAVVLSVAKNWIGEWPTAWLRSTSIGACAAGVILWAVLSGAELSVEALALWVGLAYGASQIAWSVPIKGAKMLVDSLGS